jgi:hypothetical protein
LETYLATNVVRPRNTSHSRPGPPGIIALVERRKNMTPVPQPNPVPAETGGNDPREDEATSCLSSEGDPADKNLDKDSEVEAYSQTLLKILFDW